MRTFNLTLSTTYQSLYALMLATTGAVPTNGILIDRACELHLQSHIDNAAARIYVSDRNHANNQGRIIMAGDYLPPLTSPVNSIDLRSIFVAADAGTPVLIASVRGI